MYVRGSYDSGRSLKIIYPGEYYITSENELIGTLLGSCVSVCLYDDKNRVGAMNHFMLPGKTNGTRIGEAGFAKYGIAAVNTIIAGMLKKGAERKNLEAKVFGGGRVLDLDGKKFNNMIPDNNIRVAKLILEIEDIPIIALDVGEDYTRKIIFDINSGKVFLRKMRKQKVNELVLKRDQKYIKKASGE